MTRWTELDPQTEAILLVGPMQEDRISKVLLKQGDLEDLPQIAVDGGIRTAVDPVLWVGDGDSGAMPQNIPAIFKDDQDQTDLAFCLFGMRGWRYGVLHLAGFLGGRKDHELAVMGDVCAEMKKRERLSIAIFHDNNMRPVMTMYRPGRHDLVLHGRFSVLAFEEATVSVMGDCAYKAGNLKLPAFSGRGVSNEGRGTVTVSADKPFFVLV